MTIAEGLADLRRIALDETGIAVGQIYRKEMHLALDPGDHRQSLAEVHLRMTGIVGQGHENLTAPKPPLTHPSCAPSLREP